MTRDITDEQLMHLLYTRNEVLILRTTERGYSEWVVVSSDKQLPIEYFDTKKEAIRYCKRYDFEIVK